MGRGVWGFAGVDARPAADGRPEDPPQVSEKMESAPGKIEASPTAQDPLLPLQQEEGLGRFAGEDAAMGPRVARKTRRKSLKRLNPRPAPGGGHASSALGPRPAVAVR